MRPRAGRPTGRRAECSGAGPGAPVIDPGADPDAVPHEREGARVPVVIVPEAYRGPTRGVSRIEVDASTVRAAVEAVEKDHPGFLTMVLDGGGKLHPFVKLFVNEAQLPADALDTPLAKDDRLEILAAIAGGAGAPRDARAEAARVVFADAGPPPAGAARRADDRRAG